jgi:hypothetical protein
VAVLRKLVAAATENEPKNPCRAGFGDRHFACGQSRGVETALAKLDFGQRAAIPFGRSERPLEDIAQFVLVLPNAGQSEREPIPIPQRSVKSALEVGFRHVRTPCFPRGTHSATQNKDRTEFNKIFASQQNVAGKHGAYASKMPPFVKAGPEPEVDDKGRG